MKRAILEGTKIGAIVGFSLAILNCFLVLASVELSWLIPEPRKVVIFTSDFFAQEFFPFLFTSLLWAAPFALLGSVIAGLFGFMLVKYQFDKEKYVVVCTQICALMAGIYLVIVTWFFWMSEYRYMANRLFYNEFGKPIDWYRLIYLSRYLLFSGWPFREPISLYSFINFIQSQLPRLLDSTTAPRRPSRAPLLLSLLIPPIRPLPGLGGIGRPRFLVLILAQVEREILQHARNGLLRRGMIHSFTRT
ncbi:MAG: hypothetical protein AB1750_09475 [Chloroflexota bacterium]